MCRVFLNVPLLALVLLSGCFTCEVPFYEDSQIVQDARLEGTYDNSRDGAKDESVWTIKRSMNHEGKYDVSVKDEDVSVELVATLFRLDKQLFVDLYPLHDSGVRHVAGVPTVSEAIRSTMYERRHVVWKVEFTDAGLTYWFPHGHGVAVVWRQAPELKPPSVDERQTIRLPPNTKDAQKYLKRFVGDPAVFGYKGELLRRKKDA
jgi:hypothetical protein